MKNKNDDSKAQQSCPGWVSRLAGGSILGQDTYFGCEFHHQLNGEQPKFLSHINVPLSPCPLPFTLKSINMPSGED